MSGFVHLHLHSEYSLLSGVCRIRAVPAYALAMGMNAVALTDSSAMYGAVEFYKACKSVGVKPIIGCQVIVGDKKTSCREDDSLGELVLLCKNDEGYRNLIYLISKSYTESMGHKPVLDFELLKSHAGGIVCLTGGENGIINRLLLVGDSQGAEKYAARLKSVFRDDLYIELQNHGLGEEKNLIPQLISLSDELDIQPVATNDVHYIKKKDALLQRILHAMKTNTTLSETAGGGLQGEEYYFKTESEMRSLFSVCERACDNTGIVADKCNFDFDFSGYIYPSVEFDGGLTPEQQLRSLAYKGFEKKVSAGEIHFKNNSRDSYTERMEYELKTVCSMGYAEYFLIVADFVNYARSHDIPTGPGRGSGAGSLVAYICDITEVDPMEYNLLFEAFLNPERISMPDFDIDFCYFKREKVIEYVKRKYGYDRVSQIVTFGTLAPRAAIRSVGKVLGMSYSRVDEVAKLLPKNPKITFKEVLGLPEIKRLCDGSPEINQLISVSKQLEGMPRNISTHAAGVVICDKPIYNYVPLTVSGEDVLTQYNMNDIASLGLLKFDFLGIRYLTVIDDTEKMIRQDNPDFDIKKVPIDDRITYELLSKGETDGVFQLESAGMKQMLTRFKPKEIRDIMSAIALYRPGPAKFIDKFITNRQNKEELDYTIPALKSILDETHGCIVYQEQVMEIFRAVAGYSYGKADVVRRAISKKKADVIASERIGFIEGAVEKGANRTDAEALFEDMTGFANYGFKKSHAAAYSFISYRTAYLKAHYPAYYTVSLLNSIMGDFTKTAIYSSDLISYGIALLPPDINKSGSVFTVTPDGSIRYGLLGLRNVGEQFVSELVAERGNGNFTNFENYCERMAYRDIGKRQTEVFIKAGAFDCFGIPRRQLLFVYEKLMDIYTQRQRNSIDGQQDMFGSMDTVETMTYPELPEFPENMLSDMEREVSGLVFSGKTPIEENTKPTAEEKSEIKSEPESKPVKKRTESTLYLRLQSFEVPEYKRVTAMIEIFTGDCNVVFYDISRNKYVKLSNMGIASTDFVLKELTELLGRENVVLRN